MRRMIQQLRTKGRYSFNTSAEPQADICIAYSIDGVIHAKVALTEKTVHNKQKQDFEIYHFVCIEYL